MFDSIGYLPAGIHDFTVEEVRGNFVDAFPHSSTRDQIFAGFVQHRAALAVLLGGFEQVLDGSFVTTKNDPGDVDCVIIADARAIDNLAPSERSAFKALVAGKLTRASYNVDAYLCPSVPSSHPLYEKYRTMRKYWLGEFGYDRVERPKGVVRVVPAGGTTGP